jgi:large subunit ribosomal protein L10
MSEKTRKIQQYKVDAVNELKSMIQSTGDIIFTDYRGLNVQQITQLRTSLTGQSAGYRVVKNNYAKIAFEELGLPLGDNFLIDPTALALADTDADVGPVAKILATFTSDSKLKIKGGLIDGKMVSPEDVTAISRLPGRDQLYAMLMGTIKAPLTNLVYAMNGVLTKLVRTLQAVAESKSE